MKTFLFAAALTAALNSSIVWADSVLIALSGASEPVGLVLWGLALFVIAGSLKKRTSGAQASANRDADRSWIVGTRPSGEVRSAQRESAGLEARNLEARI